jgi:hypothetical protein
MQALLVKILGIGARQDDIRPALKRSSGIRQVGVIMSCTYDLCIANVGQGYRMSCSR